MRTKQRRYDQEYKTQVLKLVEDLGSAKRAADELGVPVDTIYGWTRAVRDGRLDI